ncbi:MAG: RNA polymerase sigma factor region1.1 domain-containing protein, partial [Burkholderiaceae bacterium]
MSQPSSKKTPSSAAKSATPAGKGASRVATRAAAGPTTAVNGRATVKPIPPKDVGAGVPAAAAPVKAAAGAPVAGKPAVKVSAPNEKLKARERKAKEKAFLREALAARQPGTEEELEARRTKLKTLIKLGKERGFLTYAEINDHLPDDVVDAEAIEGIIGTFNDMGIAVYDQAPDAETLLINDNAPVATSDDDAEEEAEAALSTVDSEFGRTTDPVR